MTFSQMIISVFAVATLIACGPVADAGDKPAPRPVMETQIENPALTAVLVYAKWCPSCKILDPRLASIRTQNEFPTTQFVTLDYTKKNKDSFYAQADSADVGDVLRAKFASGIKTGQVLLIDMNSHAIVGILDKSMSEAELIQAITAASAQAE